MREKGPWAKKRLPNFGREPNEGVGVEEGCAREKRKGEIEQDRNNFGRSWTNCYLGTKRSRWHVFPLFSEFLFYLRDCAVCTVRKMVEYFKAFLFFELLGKKRT